MAAVVGVQVQVPGLGATPEQIVVVLPPLVAVKASVPVNPAVLPLGVTVAVKVIGVPAFCGDAGLSCNETVSVGGAGLGMVSVSNTWSAVTDELLVEARN